VQPAARQQRRADAFELLARHRPPQRGDDLHALHQGLGRRGLAAAQQLVDAAEQGLQWRLSSPSLSRLLSSWCAISKE